MDNRSLQNCRPCLMFDLSFNKDDSFFLKKKLESSWGAPQENDNKFSFAINPQGIWQFHDNC